MLSYLIYGANGYTGELIAREAARRGHRPILAGRDGAAVGALAAELGLATGPSRSTIPLRWTRVSKASRPCSTPRGRSRPPRPRW